MTNEIAIKQFWNAMQPKFDQCLELHPSNTWVYNFVKGFMIGNDGRSTLTPNECKSAITSVFEDAAVYDTGADCCELMMGSINEICFNGGTEY